MIVSAFALLLGTQAGSLTVASEPSEERFAACEEQYGESYAALKCLGLEPEYSEETYVRCNLAHEAQEAALEEDDDGSGYAEIERDYYQCLGILSAQYSPIDEVITRLPDRHPSDYYLAAARLFHQEDRPTEGLFWLYAGKLRWRAHLECNPPEPGGEGAAFGAMNAMVGEDLNAYAAERVDLWLETIDNVLAWDRATPERYEQDRGQACDAALEDQREGLAELRAHIVETRADIEAEAAERRSVRDTATVAEDTEY